MKCKKTGIANINYLSHYLGHKFKSVSVSFQSTQASFHHLTIHSIAEGTICSFNIIILRNKVKTGELIK